MQDTWTEHNPPTLFLEEKGSFFYNFWQNFFFFIYLPWFYRHFSWNFNFSTTFHYASILCTGWDTYFSQVFLNFFLQLFVTGISINFGQQVASLIQCDHKGILGSGPWVPDCYNGKIQSFFAESGPFPDHFFNFSGLLVVIFIQIVKKGYKM